MTTKNKHFISWLLLLCVVMMPNSMRADDGLFEKPKQAFTWEARTPGCIHLKILVSHKSAERYLKEATFYVNETFQSSPWISHSP